jgi:hypothetical protein
MLLKALEPQLTHLQPMNPFYYRKYKELQWNNEISSEIVLEPRWDTRIWFDKQSTLRWQQKKRIPNSIEKWIQEISLWKRIYFNE